MYMCVDPLFSPFMSCYPCVVKVLGSLTCRLTSTTMCRVVSAPRRPARTDFSLKIRLHVGSFVLDFSQLALRRFSLKPSGLRF